VNRAALRGWLYAALGLLFVLHHDLWFWNDARMIAGLPVGLVYHVLYCVAVSVLMGLVVRHAWPPRHGR
jgi:hypothetical protein